MSKQRVLSQFAAYSKKLFKFDFIKESIRRLDKGGIVYTILNFSIYGVYFLRALIIPKLLDSYSYGIFSVFNLYLRFVTIFDLGSISYLQKEVAVDLHNQNGYNHKLERQVIFLNIGLVLISTVFFLLFNRDVTGKIHLFDLLFWISIAAFSQMYVIKTGVLRSLEKFKVLSKVLLTNALLSTVIVIFFVLKVSNIYFIYLVYLLSVFLPVIILVLKTKFGSLLPLDFLAHSWPIFLYNILMYMYVSIDKFIIKHIYSFLDFSTYSLYSTIITSIFMAVSLLWSMFYSRIFSKKSDVSEKLDTVNILIIFLCVCLLKVAYPLFHKFFPNYTENINFYNVSLQYAALVYFLPNTLIKYLNNKKALILVCLILALHICLVLLLTKFDVFLLFIPLISWLTYFFLEILAGKRHNKLLQLARVLLSILLVLVCIL